MQPPLDRCQGPQEPTPGEGPSRDRPPHDRPGAGRPPSDRPAGRRPAGGRPLRGRSAPDGQLSLPLMLDEAVEIRIEEARRLFRVLSPARVCTFLVSARDDDSVPYRRALVVLGKRVAKRAKDGQDRRRLLWALGQLQTGLDDLAGAADSYHAAAAGLEDRRSAFVLACARERALCLDRLGCHEEARHDYARFRRAAQAFAVPLRALMERELGERQDEHWLFRQSHRSWGNAATHFRTCRRWHDAASAELEEAQTLMFLAHPRRAARAMARARRLFADLGDTRLEAEASRSLAELYGYWRKPRRQLAAAERAYFGYLDCGEDMCAAFAKLVCAEALGDLGRTKDRDKAFKTAITTLDRLAARGESEGLRRLYEKCAAHGRLDFGAVLIGDGRYQEGLEQMTAAVQGLDSLDDVGNWRLTRVLRAVGTARLRLSRSEESFVQLVDDSPPPPGYTLLPVGSPRLLMHLALAIGLN